MTRVELDLRDILARASAGSGLGKLCSRDKMASIYEQIGGDDAIQAALSSPRALNDAALEVADAI